MATVKGTTAADELKGTATADTISGLAGDDKLEGLAGNDILIGSLGADELIGGTEIDTASYSTATVGVIASLANSNLNTQEAAGDTYDSIENLIGSAKDDQLSGDDNANKVEGLALNDKLYGGKGADILEGGAGDDLIEGGEDADTLVGGAHTTGIGDTVSYANSVAKVEINLTQQGTYSASTGKIAVTGATKAQTGGDAAGDLLSGFEHVIGSAGDDKITGDLNANIIEGGAGADTLEGGGTGIDTLSYAGSNALVSVTLNDAAAATVSGGHAAGDVATGFENVTGSAHNDWLYGNSGNNVLEGGDGKDWLYGKVGNDTLKGGLDDDFLYGDFGADTLDGGDGNDTMLFTGGFNANLTVDLTAKTISATGNGAAEITGDKFTNMESIVAGDGNDILTGNADANKLQGDNGDDIIEGRAGADTLDGGSFGETSGDTLSYAKSTALGGVSVNLATSTAGNAGALASEAAGDTISGFENITGSKQSDILIGDGGVNKIIGGAGADIIEGGAGADILDGGAATESNTLSYAGDTTGVSVVLVAGKSATVSLGDAQGDDARGFLNIIGGAGVDKLTGDAGNNSIEGGAGADTLDGGAGTGDTLSYASSGGVTVTLNLGAAAATVSGSHAAGDTATNFENVTGSAFDDSITGTTLANTLKGGDGDDDLRGGAGNDILDGGAGSDMADFGASAAAGVTVNLLTGKASGGDGADTLISIEEILGTQKDDNLTGSNVANRISGSDGNDKIFGLAGDDKLFGNGGNDVIDGGAGADEIGGGGGPENDTVSYATATSGIVVSLLTMSGSAGDAAGDTLDDIESVTGSGKDDVIVSEIAAANLLDGGAGLDTISYAGSAGAVTIDLGKQFTVSASGVFSGATAVVVGGSGGDKIANFENAVGTAGNDSITGNAANNVIEGGAGKDALDGGAGLDTLSYASAGAAVTVKLNEGAALATVSGGDTGDSTDEAKNFENLLGSIHNDVLTGTAAATVVNILSGGDGNDKLFGLGGIDTLRGDKGDDTLTGGDKGDLLVGGDGTDTADYSSSALGVTIDLSKQGTYNATTGKIDKAVAQKGGDATGDLLAGIENVIGSNANDLFTGSSGANKFDGGGDDLDTVTYIASTVALTVDMLDGANGTGEAKGDTFVNVERLVGTKLSDTLVAADNSVILDGGDLDDTLISGDGGDILVGGLGTDTVSYQNADGPVIVDLSKAQGTYNATTGQLTGGATQDFSTGGVGDRFSGIENATGSSFGDTLKGNASANRLDGGTGDDDLQGGLGDDFLEGGDGSDTANYAGVTGPVTANLATHKATGTGIGVDTLSSVEKIIGTAANDTLTGDEYDNTLVGGDGDDILDGGAGADFISGGNDNETNGDTVTYVSATAGVTLSLLTPANSVGDAAGDTFAGIEIILGSNFADSITGDGNNNSLQGGKGNDILDGSGGIDTLEGGDGDDILIGGAGADALKGGAGEDTASYETAGTGVTVALGVAGDGDAAGDTFDLIENLTGSDHDDKLEGNNKDNVLTGGAGADELIGGANGTGDTANYASSSAAIVINLATNVNTGGDAAGDTLFTIEHVIGSDHDDSLTGDSSNNTLTGGLGDDTLEGGDGNDLLDGGAGVDTASYSGANGVNVNLGTNSATGAGIGTDTLASIENVIGSSQNDTIIGNNNVNVLDGGLGDDTLTGGESADTFIIDDVSGSDTITDFNFVFDVLDFSNVAAATDLTSAKALATYNGMDTTFAFGGGNTLVLKNTFINSLTEANFAFAPTDISIDVQGQNDVTVSEGLAIGVPVGTLIGLDDHDSGEALIYKIISDPSGLFDIKNDELVLKAGLDFEDAQSHAIDIRVYDSTGASYLETLTVNVTDANDAPTDILIDQDTITEIAAVGDVVGTLSATDQDVPANTFTYTLVDDAGGLFALDGDQIKVAGALDFEGSAVHTITVKVNDGTVGGDYVRTIDIHIEDAVEGFGVDGYVSGAKVFYDANVSHTYDIGEASTTTGTNGQFALKAGGSGDLYLIGGKDISTGEDFHGLMRAPNGASVITPLTTLWAYLIPLTGDSVTAHHATGTALGFDANSFNLATYDPITAALSANAGVAASGAALTRGAMQVQNTIALVTSILLESGVAADDAAHVAAQAVAQFVFEDLENTVNFGDAFNMGIVLARAETIGGFAIDDQADAANVIADINAAVVAQTGTGVTLLQNLAKVTAVVHLVADDFENGYDATIDDTYNSGTLAGLISGQTAQNVEGFNTADTLNGTDDADVLLGYGGADTLNGGKGNDVLDGGDGDDTLNGGDGRDVLIGSAGKDKFDGGGWFDGLSGASFGDFDIVSFADSPAMSVWLAFKTSEETLLGSVSQESIDHVEGLIGSKFQDSLRGGANDYLETFQGGGGDDIIHGFGGIDRAIYSDAVESVFFEGIQFNLAAGQALGFLNGVGNDSLRGIEEIVGTAFKDTYNATGFGNFSTNAGSRGTYNSFAPGDGDDLIIGNGNTQLDYSNGAHGITVDLTTGVFKGGAGFGTDTFSGVNRVRGTAFDDVLTGGQDAYGQPGVSEVYTGGGGNDKITGGSGFDIANYAFATGAYSIGINVNLAAGTVTGDATQVGTDTLRGIEGIVGTAEIDTYNAVGFSTTSVNAAAFNIFIDEFEGGAGNDIITGSGLTRLSYINATAGMTIDLSAGLSTPYFIEGNASVGKDSIQGGVMSVRGTRFDDKLIGFDNGTDTAQFFEAADGNDIIDGKGGYDIASYLWDTSVKDGITVYLAAGTVVGRGGSTNYLPIGSDTLLGVEGVRGTNFADYFDATGFSTTTGANKASLSSKAGTTTGFNTFEGGGGNDSVIGNGATRVEFGAATGGVVVTLVDDTSGKGTATGDISVGFDTFGGGVANLRGSSYDDVLTGNKNFNSIEGKGGNDIIRGGAGNDKLDGGEYMDGISASGMNDFDWLDFSSSTAGVSVTLQSVTFSLATGSIADHTKFLGAKDGLGGTDATRGFEAVRGGSGADTLTGGVSVFEIFQGGAGKDTIWGIGGMDIASYVDGFQGMTFTLGAGGNFTVTDAFLGEDTLKQIEGIYGTAFNDKYDASAFWFGDTGGVNIFRGGGGDDNIIGNTKAFEQSNSVGRTVLDYGDATAGMTINLTLGKVDGSHAGVGIDTFSGGINGIIGTNFNDVLIGGQADRNRTAFDTNSARFETFDGGKGNDFIDGGSGFDYAVYNRGLGALQTKGIHVMLADGIVIGDADVFGTDTLRGVEIIVGTQLDDIFDARGFGLSSKNGGYDSREYGLIPVIDEVPGAYNEFAGGAGNDLIYGNGYTLLNYGKATAGLVADLNLTAGAIVGKNASVGTDSIGNLGKVRSIIGTDYVDIITGDDQDNYILGGFEKIAGTGDVLNGNGGNDFISGGNGDDRITGGTGDDYLGGGFGTVGGGSNNDTFVFFAGHGDDTLNDFRWGGENDKIEAVGIFADVADLLDSTTFEPGQIFGPQTLYTVVVDTGGGNSITFTRFDQAYTAQELQSSFILS